MNSNPYSSPSGVNERSTVRRRVPILFDVAAILFAAMPLIACTVLIFAAALLPPEQMPSDVVLGLSFMSSIFPWLVGVVCSLIGAFGRRRLAYVGLAVSVPSFALWLGLVIYGAVS
jgi:hypothetical protein